MVFIDSELSCGGLLFTLFLGFFVVGMEAEFRAESVSERHGLHQLLHGGDVGASGGDIDIGVVAGAGGPRFSSLEDFGGQAGDGGHGGGTRPGWHLLKEDFVGVSGGRVADGVADAAGGSGGEDFEGAARSGGGFGCRNRDRRIE